MMQAQHVRRLIYLSSGSTGVFNAGSGIGTSVHDMIDLVETVAGKTLAKPFGPGRTVDTPVSVLDVGAAESELGWTPRVGLLDGLRATWDWPLSHAQTQLRWPWLASARLEGPDRARDNAIRRDDGRLTASVHEELPGRGIMQVGGAIRGRQS